MAESSGQHSHIPGGMLNSATNSGQSHLIAALSTPACTEFEQSVSTVRGMSNYGGGGPLPPHHLNSSSRSHSQHGHGTSGWFPNQTMQHTASSEGFQNQMPPPGAGGPIRVHLQQPGRAPLAPYPQSGPAPQMRQVSVSGGPPQQNQQVFHQQQTFSNGSSQSGQGQVVQQLQQRPIHISSQPPLSVPPGHGGQQSHMGTPPMMQQQIHGIQQQGGQPSQHPPLQHPPGTVVQQFPMTGGSLMDKARLDDLVKQIDANTVLEDNVKEALMEYADEFVDEIIDRVCRLVQHRGNHRLEARDVELVLDMVYRMPSVPRAAVHVFGQPPTVQPKIDGQAPTEAHKQRMMMIKKQLKKP